MPIVSPSHVFELEAQIEAFQLRLQGVIPRVWPLRTDVQWVQGGETVSSGVVIGFGNGARWNQIQVRDNATNEETWILPYNIQMAMRRAIIQ